ncbi:unnamed protein product [Acanthoscelides obtectus]|uniref:Uncharacterized protein n=1 Tax=Acanthoscelides obtectus TaxID=200917 RepID=A0A9P0JY29_ACAOB|nr:unnamed protein product [Acanthoscelides obtectus]CAK1646098.1 hypothetical protein AOBTE_LOCUS14457 [Acanthoscelides obtectus]
MPRCKRNLVSVFFVTGDSFRTIRGMQTIPRPMVYNWSFQVFCKFPVHGDLPCEEDGEVPSCRYIYSIGCYSQYQVQF